MTAEITDPELTLYGAGNSVADRMAREISRLRSQRSGLSWVHAPADVREAIAIVREVSTMRRTSDRGVALSGATFDAIAAAAERGIAGALRPQRAASREQLQEIVRGVVLDVLGPCNDRPQIPDDIADHVADVLAAPQPVLDAVRVREVVRAALSEWMGAYHDTATPFDAARVSERIAARAAEQLAGQVVVERDAARAERDELSEQLEGLHRDFERLLGLDPDADTPWSTIEREVDDVLADRDAARAECERLQAALDKRPLRGFDQLAADRLADEVAVLVRRKVIDARSPAGDALLDYRDPPPSPRADRLATLEAEFVALRRALWARLEERQTMTGRIYALLATEPAVSEERCGVIERLAASATRDGAWCSDFWVARLEDCSKVISPLLSAARQLHALRAGLREIVGVGSTIAPVRITLDAQQLLDLQRMRADYEHALGRARQRAANFPGIQAIADGVSECTRWVALLDHLLSIFGGTQT